MSSGESPTGKGAQAEWDRLERRRMEFAVTMHAIMDSVPAPPGRIMDVEGGAGRYAVELARLGYRVTFLHPSDAHLGFALRKTKELGVTLTGCVQGEATNLGAFGNEMYDVALLLGPLSRLLTAADRVKAIREVRRILKPGGFVFASFTPVFAPVLYAAKRQPALATENRQDFDRLLDVGLLAVHGGHDLDFTETWFTHPSAIRPLMESNGFYTMDVIASDGGTWLLDGKLHELKGPAWQTWVDICYHIGKDPTIHGAAGKLLYVGRRR